MPNKLYLYSDFNGGVEWAASPDDWRKRTGRKGNPLRCAHIGFAVPKGYRKAGGELANDAVERVLTMKDLIAAL